MDNYRLDKYQLYEMQIYSDRRCFITRDDPTKNSNPKYITIIYFFLETRLHLTEKIGACLGIVKDKAEFYCNLHKPNISQTGLNFTVGRATIPISKETDTTLFQ